MNDRFAQRLCAPVRYGASQDELGEATSRAIAPIIAHDAVNLAGVSPATSFSYWAFGFAHEYAADLMRAQMRNVYAGNDPALPEDLLARPIPAAVLGTDGGGRRDRTTRKLLEAHGVGSELRVVLRDSRGLWGILELLRTSGGRSFDDQDMMRAVQLTPAFIAFLRRYVTAGPLSPSVPSPPPGVIIVGADNTVRAITSRGWLGRLDAAAQVPAWMVGSITSGLAIQARKHARYPGAPPALLVGPAAAYGRWIAVHGQPLEGCTPGEVAIVIQVASGDLLLPSLCDWYEITGRERQIIKHLCAGAAPKHIARMLNLSTHTVNDHLKAVYRKTGADGRDELIAALTP
ncbi:helix-turn-helix transcriptional regulator [Nocardia arthritidis]|uniref:helix-turn-helix transcriptional regulator n=1 Tax=Nocardia arthritidis TaxID=228602 RepID=UPI00193433CC|nr:helix-turn-helix transcriptional regulator [Nocardia arthritidis]